MSRRNVIGAELAPVIIGFRVLFASVAWIFVAGATVQVFLVGLSLFQSAAFWPDHENLGLLLSLPALVLPVTAFLAKTGRKLTRTALAVMVLYIVQITLPNLGGYVAAFHALNAFVLIGIAGHVALHSLALVRSRQGELPGEARLEGADA